MPRTRLLRNETYGALVRSARTALGWTQEQLAGELKRDARYVQRIENEGIVPLAGDRAQLEKHLRLSPSDTQVALGLPAAGELSTGPAPLNGVTRWSTFIVKAIRTPAVRLVRIESNSRALGPIAWKERFEIPHFAQTDFIRLELDLNLLDIDLRLGTGIYCLWLVVDSEQVTCLCPNPEIAPDCRIKDPLFTIPGTGIDQPLAFYGARGQHALFVILSKSTFPDRLYALIQAPQPVEELDEIAASLIAVSDLKMLRTDFVVD